MQFLGCLLLGLFSSVKTAFLRILPQSNCALMDFRVSRSNEVVKSIDGLKLIFENSEWLDSLHLPGIGKSMAIIIYCSN